MKNETFLFNGCYLIWNLLAIWRKIWSVNFYFPRETFITDAAILVLWTRDLYSLFFRFRARVWFITCFHCNHCTENECSFLMIPNLAIFVHFDGKKFDFYWKIGKQQVFFLLRTWTFLNENLVNMGLSDLGTFILGKFGPFQSKWNLKII